MYSFTSLIHRQRRETLEYVDQKIEFGLKGTVSVISSGSSMQGNARMSTAYSTVSRIQRSAQRSLQLIIQADLDTFTHIFLYWTNTERFYGFDCKSLHGESLKITLTVLSFNSSKVHSIKDVMQGKLFQKCTHLLYCSVLSLDGNVNTRRMSKPDMGSIFHIKKINEIFWSLETIM